MSAAVFIGACLAGGAGALCRMWVGNFVNAHWRFKTKMGTFTVNCTACFLDGLLAGLTAHFLASWTGMASLSYILGTGFLGGYSTFSTASVEGFENFKKGSAQGLAFVGGMYLISVGLCFAGFFLGLA